MINLYFKCFLTDDDEKELLGSIILPSYTVSPCGKNDGVSKKYAFKVFHL